MPTSEAGLCGAVALTSYAEMQQKALQLGRIAYVGTWLLSEQTEAKCYDGPVFMIPRSLYGPDASSSR